MKKNIMCRIIGHQWDHCKCKRCGVTQNANHVWDGCQCKICRRTRDEEHIFGYMNGSWGDAEQHNLTCKRCYQTKSEAHQWVIDEDGDKRCSICGYTIEVCPKCGSFDTEHQEIFDPGPFEMRPGIRCRSCDYEWRPRFWKSMR